MVYCQDGDARCGGLSSLAQGMADHGEVEDAAPIDLPGKDVDRSTLHPCDEHAEQARSDGVGHRQSENVEGRVDEPPPADAEEGALGPHTETGEEQKKRVQAKGRGENWNMHGCLQPQAV